MKKKENEFDTSFLNDIQEFDDINSDEVFSFDSSMDKNTNDSEENVTNSSLLSNDENENTNVDFEFPADFSFEDTITPAVSSESENNEVNTDDDTSSSVLEEEGQSNFDFEFPKDFNFNGIASTAEQKVEEPSENINMDSNIEDDGFKSFDDVDTKEDKEVDNNKLAFEPIPGITDLDNNEEIKDDAVNTPDIPFVEPEEIVQENDNKSVDSQDESEDNQENNDKIDENATATTDDDFESKLQELELNTDFDASNTEMEADTDINSLFVKVNSNVKEASDIFLKNVEMKKKIDERFNELKQLQASVEESKKHDYDEINNYKDKVIKELMEKKEEVEERLNTLKEMQSSFEKEKDEFEDYKRDENIKIEDTRREAEASFESHKEELEKLEEKMRKQKAALEEERRQLSLDQIQYESDKNELANNMLKFNEIVGKFTDGMDKFN